MVHGLAQLPLFTEVFSKALKDVVLVAAESSHTLGLVAGLTYAALATQRWITVGQARRVKV